MIDTENKQILSNEVLSSWRAYAKNIDDLKKNYEEIYNHNRLDRETQIGKTQIDKIVEKKVTVTDALGAIVFDDFGNPKTTFKEVLKKAIRIPIPLKEKIIDTSVAFEFGNPVTRIPSEKNDLAIEVEEVWKSNRLDSALQELKKEQKSITQSAWIAHIKKDSNGKTKIKSRVLKLKDGQFYPVKDEFGDMIYFVWEFEKSIGESKIKCIWVYDETHIDKYENIDGSYELREKAEHYFKKIPVVYFEQDLPEAHNASHLIDRYETSLSKLAASNNYSGQPILFTTGKLTTPLDGDADGKHLNSPIITDDQGRPLTGDAKFITNNNAPDSVKLEQETLKQLISECTSTPDLSLKSMQGVGNIAGASLELLFLDPILKAKFNEGRNSIDIQRMINVIISGIVNLTGAARDDFKAQAETLKYEIKFNSIMPNDTKSLMETLKTAIESGVLSKQTAIDILPFTKSTEEEMELLKSEINTIKNTE